MKKIVSTLARKSKSFVSDLVKIVAFLLFEHLLPKRRGIWCFCTWDSPYAHTIDNPRAVFEEIKNEPSITKVVLRRPSQIETTSTIEGINVVVVNVESLKGAYYLALSKVIILGYGLSGLCSYGRYITKRHKIVQLWHGIPLKRIGKLFPGERFWDSETEKYTATVCSSPSDQAIMAAAFAPTPNIWISGLPRNDLILKDESDLPIDYRQQLSKLKTRISGRKFILYAPTWREGNSGVYQFSDQEWETLKSFMVKHNAVMGIRAHANRRRLDNQADDQLSRAIFFLNDIPDVNVILRVADVLVTDYSSIYIDFLLTGRPVLNFTYDIDSYVSERGFLYNLDDAMVDTWFKTFEELLTRIDRALSGMGVNAPQYSRVRSLFHNHGNRSSLLATNKIKELAES